MNKCVLKMSTLLVFLLVLAACGKDKTIYENETVYTNTSSASGSTTSTSTSTTTSSTTPLTGAALFQADCSGCHTSASLSGATLAEIQAAIANNTGGMGTTNIKALTTDQLTSLATYLANP
jgi:cytochrome c5